MSRENVEVVRRGFEAMSRGDLSQVLAIIHPDFEVSVPAELSPEPDTYRGHEGIRRYFRSFEAEMEEIRFLPERFWEVDDMVVVAVRLTAKGKSTGIPVEQLTGQVWTVVDGRARTARIYPDPADALDAVGLRE